MPPSDHTGVPIHFHSSTASGAALRMSLRMRLRVSPRQSPSSAIRPEIISEAELPLPATVFFMIPPYLERLQHEPAIGDKGRHKGHDHGKAHGSEIVVVK